MSADRFAGWLEDMLKAARQACGYVEDMPRDAFLADSRTQQAVAMNVLIIGEVAAKLIDRYPERLKAYANVPWVSMKGMRNRIAHGYFEIDMNLVWGTVSRDLPALVEQLTVILASEGGPTDRG